MKYIKKNRKSDEKKVVSTRIRTHIFDAFQNASEASKDHGYSISLSDVVETALIAAVREFAEVSDVDYLNIELDRLHKEWEEEWEKEQEKQSRKHWEKEEAAMDEDFKQQEKAFEEKFEEERIKQLETDQKAVLEMNDEELQEYRRKRIQAEEDAKIKTEKLIKEAKRRFGSSNKGEN